MFKPFQARGSLTRASSRAAIPMRSRPICAGNTIMLSEGNRQIATTTAPEAAYATDLPIVCQRFAAKPKAWPCCPLTTQ
jgi:hypothetical protein